MDLAVRTTASPAAIWTIVVVAVVLLAFWLGMIWYADAHPYVRQSRLPDLPGPGAATLDDGALANLEAAPSQSETRVPEQRPPAQPIPGQRTPASGSAPAETASRPGAGDQG